MQAVVSLETATKLVAYYGQLACLSVQTTCMSLVNDGIWYTLTYLRTV